MAATVRRADASGIDPDQPDGVGRPDRIRWHVRSTAIQEETGNGVLDVPGQRAGVHADPRCHVGDHRQGGGALRGEEVRRGVAADRPAVPRHVHAGAAVPSGAAISAATFRAGWPAASCRVSRRPTTRRSPRSRRGSRSRSTTSRDSRRRRSTAPRTRTSTGRRASGRCHSRAAPICCISVCRTSIFHATTAYNILRHRGVELGKRDFLGSF